MKHWAAPLIGAPYKAGASGPCEFDCIGLVRYYFRERHGLELPDYDLAGGTTAELAAFVRATRARRVGSDLQDEDIVTMENFQGRHVGVAVRTSEGLGLLHAVGNNTKGSVVWQPMHTLVCYRNKQAWRLSCSN